MARGGPTGDKRNKDAQAALKERGIDFRTDIGTGASTRYVQEPTFDIGLLASLRDAQQKVAGITALLADYERYERALQQKLTDENVGATHRRS